MTDLAVELDLPSAEPADPNSIRVSRTVDGSLVDGRHATPEEVAGAVAEAKSAFPGWADVSRSACRSFGPPPTHSQTARPIWRG